MIHLDLHYSPGWKADLDVNRGFCIPETQKKRKKEKKRREKKHHPHAQENECGEYVLKSVMTSRDFPHTY